MTTEITRIYHRGTTIVKIENEVYQNGLLDIFSDDFIYCSLGFLNALNRGLVPTTKYTEEFHHYFEKQNDGTFECKKINFC